MNYYVDSNNNVFAFEDGDPIPAGLTPVSESQAMDVVEGNKPAPTHDEINGLRCNAYTYESDPIYFKAQRGEATMDEWLAKIAEIKASLPYPPVGTIFTGRGAGSGPLDLNVSYFTSWESAAVDESDTELYIPETGVTIAYGSGGPGKFDSAGNCFNSGNYLVKIRQASTGAILSQFECPLNPDGQDVAFGI
jgi:hypothetical protein